jgi:hypothetical protein
MGTIMKLCLGSFLLSLTLLLATPSARADALPPETWPCVDRKAGDACTDATTQQAGACVNDTCTNTKPGGTSTSYACVKCVAGAPPHDDGGCTVGKQTAVRRTAPWFLAGLFSLLFLARNRRRPR